MNEYLKSTALAEVFNEHPYAEDFFISIGLKKVQTDLTMSEFLYTLSDELIEDCGMESEEIFSSFTAYLEEMNMIKRRSNLHIREITIIGGHDKSGNLENIVLSMKPSEIICIVGPTGAGKSRLLADIECLAQKDTPTGRHILLNGKIPSADNRFSIEHKLVAQLSQNMNFIMDLTVGEFVAMHAESRMITNISEIVKSIIECANELAGEKFTLDTPVTALSGGQSRALMIADTALLSRSPIILIDEIENAGVDRKKALELLVKKEKIVLMSTHDPILALMGDKRIVIKNGGINKIVETSKAERENLDYLQKLDTKLVILRNMLRSGDKIDFNIEKYLCI
jgi:ABC-type lipoprotein export system ATPase subunit